MKSRIASTLAALLWATTVCCSVALAQIPKTINYQGYLTSPSGAAINNPSVSMMFKLYDAVTGGNLLHTETQTVAVSNGIFNVVLGTTTALTASFAGPVWLGVKVGADAEMTPRQPIAASPYAIRAAVADALAEFGSFFGMTAGPGNTGTNDYPATIAISAAGPSVAAGSAVNFPRASAPAVGGIAINNPGAAQTNNTEFILPSVGTYRVTWHISVDEPVQWSLWISTGPNPVPGGLFVELSAASGAPASVGQSTGTAQLVGDVVFRNSVANSAIQIRNYASPSAVTVTPLPGGTRAQAVSLIIQRLQ